MATCYSILCVPRMNQLPPAFLKDCQHVWRIAFTACLKDCIHGMPEGLHALHAYRTCLHCMPKMFDCTGCLKDRLPCMPEGLPALPAWRIACTACLRIACTACMKDCFLHACRISCTAFLKDCLHCMSEGLLALHAWKIACTACLKDCLH